MATIEKLMPQMKFVSLRAAYNEEIYLLGLFDILMGKVCKSVYLITIQQIGAQKSFVLTEDKKKFGIGGSFIRLAHGKISNGLCRTRVSCSFSVQFFHWRYFVVISFEDRLSDSNFLIVDRQSGALAFEVARSTWKTILRTVDLDREFWQSELAPCA